MCRNNPDRDDRGNLDGFWVIKHKIYFLNKFYFLTRQLKLFLGYRDNVMIHGTQIYILTQKKSIRFFR